MQQQANLPLVNAQLSSSKRGGQILHTGGRSYQVTVGKLEVPIEELLPPEELADINPNALGRPRFTPLYLRCRACAARASIKKLENNTYFEFQMTSGYLLSFC